MSHPATPIVNAYSDYEAIFPAASRLGVTRYQLLVAAALGHIHAVSIAGRILVKRDDVTRWGASLAAGEAA